MAKAPSYNKEKASERLLGELSRSLREDISDPRLSLVTLTRIELSPDKAYAKVYWDCFDTQRRDEVRKALHGACGKMRTALGRRIKMRHVPEITFCYDSQFDDEKNIEDLLKSEGHVSDSENI